MPPQTFWTLLHDSAHWESRIACGLFSNGSIRRAYRFVALAVSQETLGPSHCVWQAAMLTLTFAITALLSLADQVFGKAKS